MVDDAEPSADTSWQQRAVERSLTNARARAVSRSGQILDAARELLEETGGVDFTVQEIVDRSGLSLRSFYKHFGGKDELLLALFEEILRTFAGVLRRAIEAEDDPVAQLRTYVTVFHGRAQHSTALGGRALGTYHIRMLEVRHQEFAVAIAPQMEVLAEIIEAGVASGAFRRDLTSQQLTGMLTITLMSVAQMSVLDVDLAGTPLGVEQVWAWCAAAVGVDPDATGAPVAAKPRAKAGAKRPAKRAAKRPGTAAARRSG